MIRVELTEDQAAAVVAAVTYLEALGNDDEDARLGAFAILAGKGRTWFDARGFYELRLAEARDALRQRFGGVA